jgi:hypothetical protein
MDAAHGALRVVADSDEPDRRRAAGQAMSESRIYETREKLLMTGSPAVVRAGEQTFRRLADMRKAIRDGARTTQIEYHEPYHVFAESLWALRNAMRVNLGGTELTPADLDKQSWDGKAECAVCQVEPVTVP